MKKTRLRNVTEVTDKAYDTAKEMLSGVKDRIWAELDELGPDQRQSYMFALQNSITTEYLIYDMRRGIRDRREAREAEEDGTEDS